MKYLMIGLILVNIGCGTSYDQKSTLAPPIGQPAPSHGSTIQHAVASRNGGTVTNGNFASNAPNRVYVPLASNIVITQNTTQAFTVTLIIKTMSCTYTHNAGDMNISSTTCSTSFVDVIASDTILLSINAGPTNQTTVETDFAIDY